MTRLTMTRPTMTFLGAAAAAALLLSPAAQAKPLKHRTDHASHRVVHATSKHRTARVTVAPGPRRGYVPGIGEVLYGDANNGPPNGGAYTLHPTGDPSIGYFPNLWAAQRTGDCINDDGYGRFSACGGR